MTSSHQTRSGPSVTTLMLALLSACLAFQLNASMLSPALVSIERQLNVTAGAVANTQSAFFIAAAMFALFLPRLADIVGRRRVLCAALMIMTVGCVISALATNIQMLFVGRIIQGASGPVIPIALVMLRVEVPEPKKYGTLLGVVTAVNGGIAGFDALLGGYLVTNHGFHSIFWTMGAVAVIAAILVRIMTRESFGADRRRLDISGTVLLVLAVGAALIAINETGKLGNANWWIATGTAVFAVVAFTLFWMVEERIPAPLVPVSQMRQRSTWALISTTALALGGVFAMMNGIVPALAQDDALGFRLDAETTSALTLTPYAIAGLLMGPLSGRLAASFGYKSILRLGLIGTVVGMTALAFGVHSNEPAFLFIVAICVGITYAGMANIMLNGLGVVLSPPERPGSLPGLNTGAFNIGAGLSFVVIYAIQAAATTDPAMPAAGYIAAVIGSVLMLAGAFAMSFVIPRPTSAEATAPRPETAKAAQPVHNSPGASPT
ncbi:MFS transporter [Mycobacterium sp. 21AC1]|uniref:MFS transporter n=1 Tax=[Mycobacterium] appelbergii TaxID=2939269 RepID=UPI002938FA24|nr:MFS transporter [Mycobacterium sp. 21AC1]MDV3128379.1 MFS transporter [Mycobacterium sp. 21AC1]